MIIVLVIFVILILLAVFLCFLDTNFNMVYRKSYVLSGTRCSEVTAIPHVIHQTWKTSSIPASHLPWTKTWRDGLTDWSFILHTDADMERFVVKEFPYYLPVWYKLHPFIKRVDTVRYMWMLRVGGVYTDLDTSLEQKAAFLKIFDVALVPPVAFVPTTQTSVFANKDKASPAFLASHKNHPLWVDVLEVIAETGWKAHIQSATGPIALTNAVKRWECTKQTASVVELSEPYMGIGPFGGVFRKPIIKHHNSGMWEHGKGGEQWKIPESVFTGLRQERARAQSLHAPV